MIVSSDIMDHEKWLEQHDQMIADHDRIMTEIKESQLKTEQGLARTEQGLARTEQGLAKTEQGLAKSEQVLRRAIRLAVQDARRQRKRNAEFDEQMREIRGLQQQLLKALLERGGNGNH